MKLTPPRYTAFSASGHLVTRGTTLLRLTLLLAALAGWPLGAANVTWTGGANHGSGTVYWGTAANWDSGTVPTNTDNAILGTASSINAYYDFDANTYSVGCVTVGASHPSSQGNQILRCSSGLGVLILNGAGGILVSNLSQNGPKDQLQFGQNLSPSISLYLASSGVIYGATSTSTNLFYIPIGETNGSFGFTKTGPNTMTLWAQSGCTYSGPTYVNEGTIRFHTPTSALGTNTIYLAGGNLLVTMDRSGVSPTPSPIVVTGDSTIYSDGPRTFPFSGSFSGSSGSLGISCKGVAGNTLTVRLQGGFSFSRPVTVGVTTGPLAEPIGAFSLLQLYNSATNGTQTFSGKISGEGTVQRTGATSSPGGTTIFTGDNDYAGGTIIDYGTLLANNTAGSALGAGAVTVTNLGVLGGNGSIAVSPYAVTVSAGGTLSPGAAATNIGNLHIDGLTLGPSANYLWHIKSAAGTAGVDWDLLTVVYWYDSASSASPIRIKVDSLGAAPIGWDASTARDWVLIQSSQYPAFTLSDFALDTTAFKGDVAGVFALSVDGGGSLHLTYTPAPDTVINVPSGTKTQTDAGYATLTGAAGLRKIGNGELVLDNPFNDYLGSTKVLAGKLSLNVDAVNSSPGALGNSSTATYLGDSAGTSNATLNINVDGVTLARGIVVQAGSSGLKTIGTTLATGNAYFTGDISLQDSATLSTAGAAASFGGNFSGPGGVTLNGPGAFTLSGIGTYAGPTTVNGPVLNLNGPAFSTNTLTFASPITLDNLGPTAVTLNSCPQNWNGDLSFVGTADLNLGAGPVTLGGNRKVAVTNGNLIVGGPIAGNGGLTKVGNGALILTAPTNSTYTGGTTNLGGVLVVNGTATFGTGAGTLLLAGGNVLCTSSHEAAPLANPVVITTDTIIYGTNRTGPTYLAFSGPFTVASGTLTVGNKGWLGTTAGLRLQGNYTLNQPIVVGNLAFDRASTYSYLDLFNDTNAAPQVVNGLISGAGVVRRGAVRPNTGGTTIFTAQNTYSGGAMLTGGALGFGADSISSAGVVSSSPIGTGLFTIGDLTSSELSLTVFAYGGPRVIDNPLFINGALNVTVAGTNDLTLTGPINAGGVAKTWTVLNTGLTTLSGQITNTTGSDGAPLIKAGPGTLVLSADNLYAGATTISNGTLLANNTIGSATSTNTVYVRAGGTLGGTGTVAGRVSVTGGSIAPGHGTGTLTVGGGVNLSSGGSYVWDLAANANGNPGSDFDVLAVTGGTVTLGGTSQLVLNFTGSATVPAAGNAFWQSPHAWTILTVSGGAANPGPTKFPTIVNGVLSAGSFTNYADASGNIVLAYVPGASPRPVLSSTIVGAGTANATLSWSAVGGFGYQVQYKTNLNQVGWLVLGNVTSGGATASFTDTNGPSSQRYYRVIIR